MMACAIANGAVQMADASVPAGDIARRSFDIALHIYSLVEAMP